MARRCVVGLVSFLAVLASACSREAGRPSEGATPAAHVEAHTAGAPPSGGQVLKDAAGNILTEERFAELVMDGRHRIMPATTAGGVQVITVREKTAEETEREVREGLRLAKRMTPIRAPEIGFTDISGATVSAAELRGKVVVLNFWFPACKPCVAEIPELNRLVDRYASRGVVLLAPSPRDTTTVERFLATHRFTYRVCPNAKEAVARFKVAGYPTNLVIDRKGMVIVRETALGPATVALVERGIQEALGGTR